jgi:hypothetical protein
MIPKLKQNENSIIFSKKMICQGVYSCVNCPREIDNEVIEDSNNAVSGGAVYNAIQSIPVGPSGPTIQTFTDVLEGVLINGGGLFTENGTLFMIGNLIYGYMNITSEGQSVSLTLQKIKCATLKPEIPVPMYETPFQVIIKPPAALLGDGLPVNGYIDVDGSVYFGKNAGSITLQASSVNRIFVSWATALSN